MKSTLVALSLLLCLFALCAQGKVQDKTQQTLSVATETESLALDTATIVDVAKQAQAIPTLAINSDGCQQAAQQAVTLTNKEEAKIARDKAKVLQLTKIDLCKSVKRGENVYYFLQLTVSSGPHSTLSDGFTVFKNNAGNWALTQGDEDTFNTNEDLASEFKLVDSKGDLAMAEIPQQAQQFLAMNPNTAVTGMMAFVESESDLELALEARTVVPLEPTKQNCGFYFRQVAAGKLRLSNYWRTGSYMLNAYCACLNTPNSPRANHVRGFLQQRINAGIASGVKEFSTRKIYQDHVDAYRSAGCPCGPASYWAWFGVTNVPLKMFGTTQLEKPIEEWVTDAVECKLVEWSIRTMGSCNGCYVGSFSFCTPCASF